MRFTSSFVLTVSLLLALFTPSARAQNIPADVYKVNYFSNANTAGAPDGALRMINPGESNGNMCAYIAVFDPFEEMSECCGCLVSPDGLATLSVNIDLTSNPLTGQLLQNGVIKIVTARPVANACPLPTNANQSPTLEPGIRAWTTHIQNSNFTITETASQDSTLSKQELFSLGAQCSSILLVGSGKGICTCGSGGL